MSTNNPANDAGKLSRTEQPFARLADDAVDPSVQVPLLPADFPGNDRTTINLPAELVRILGRYAERRSLDKKSIFERALRAWLTIYTDQIADDSSANSDLVSSQTGRYLENLSAIRRIPEELLCRLGAQTVVLLLSEPGVNGPSLLDDLSARKRHSGRTFGQEVAQCVRVALQLAELSPKSLNTKKLDQLRLAAKASR